MHARCVSLARLGLPQIFYISLVLNVFMYTVHVHVGLILNKLYNIIMIPYKSHNIHNACLHYMYHNYTLGLC
jgi:hypothetical protein